ncbi:MAG: UDP-3-O-acyl-N-acetylglucosamine deacetylase [Thermodesulfovibrionales bacterium]|nr:UDP-3-O-acyl-N-acetylglucosamine deacetylase [Thermodesulfovibrionales bacterium]
MRPQRTIGKEIFFEGKGLHSGCHSSVLITPAPVNTGIVFYKAGSGAIPIKASIYNVVETAFATTIESQGIKIKTIEHLLAAIGGLGIDNLFITVEGPEIPILDGSSTIFSGMLLEAGIIKQNRSIEYLKIKRPIVYEDYNSRIIALPYNGYCISYYINFNNKFLSQQELTIEITEKSFITEIAPARTFGFLKDVETLRKNGLAKGGSLDNAIVIGDEGILNPEGLRFSDEFVRHKILDSMGDILLAGRPIIGHIIFEKAGHTANINFLRKLLSSTEHFTIITDSPVYEADSTVLNLISVK